MNVFKSIHQSDETDILQLWPFVNMIQEEDRFDSKLTIITEDTND